MKITFLNIAALSTIVLFSCNKENNLVDDFTNEVCLETAQITLPTSGGDVNESESLVQSSNNDYYTACQL